MITLKLAHLLFAVAPLDAPADVSDYYPVGVGYEWVMVDSKNKKEMTERMSSVNVKDDITLVTIDAIVDGKTTMLEHVALSKGGLTRNNMTVFSTFNLKIDIRLEPPLTLLTNPVKPGQEWKSEFKSRDLVHKGVSKVTRERIKVPAGEFDAILISSDFQIPLGKQKMQFWYAKGIGKIKQVADLPEIHWELKSYKQPKQQTQHE